ncbi:GAF domain-containing protein [Microcoleus sp. FACHB-68]|uniref:GAF domain-containing protein n=1 Tax=Microcoleus sp. FACHB-68 TaxID=2692826 RepID=UPI00168322D2|nr:GAF domain-containing protein [Microcoleus sp. FACHB-68]MBD1939858.1 GAF domain-containing protein [Microcoleus sp. FACHB-68]
MSYLTLPSQIILHLTWPRVCSLVEILQTAVASSGRLRTLLAAGKNKELCQSLAQTWWESAHQAQQSLDPKLLLRPAGSKNPDQLLSAKNANYKPSKGPAGNPEATETPQLPTFQLIDFAEVEASLIILSSYLNIWIHLEPATTSLNSEHHEQIHPSFSPTQSPETEFLTTSITTPTWQVSLNFDPQVIVKLLSTPAVAAAAPYCSGLKATDLNNRSNVLRRVWLQLLGVVGENNADVAENPQEETIKSHQETEKLNLNNLEQQASAAHGSPLSDSLPVSATKIPGNPHPLAAGTPQAKFSPDESINNLFWEAPIGILYESLDGGILNANPAFCRLTGYTQNQLRHLDRRSISHPEDFATEVRVIQQMLNDGNKRQTLRKRYLRRDGSFITAEVAMSLIGEEAEESYLLSFVTDLSEHQRAELEIQQRREREALLSEISAKIRATFDLDAILQTAVQRLRQALGADRVLAYQLLDDSLVELSGPALAQVNPNLSSRGLCVAEDVHAIYPTLKGISFSADCIPPPYLEAYRNGRLWSVTDVRIEELAECHHKMLEQMQVRSMMAVAIQRTEGTESRGRRDFQEDGSRQDAGNLLRRPSIPPLWGLLVVHQCHAPRQWTTDEQQLLQAVANQLAIAIEQANLVHQLQAYAHELENRVNQRTRSLEQSLKFEQLTRQLTEALLQSLGEDQMLKIAVEGLANTLGVDGCYASLFDEGQEVFEVRSQHLSGSLQLAAPLIGSRSSLQDWPEGFRTRLFAGQPCIHEVPMSQTEISKVEDTPGVQSLEATRVVSLLISPILDNQGLIGVVCVFHTTHRRFQAKEINLVEQVASQCAIAIRQARLYRQEHEQRLSAEYFRLFLEQSTDVFVEYDRQLCYLSINAAGASLIGKPQSEIIGKTNRQLIGTEASTIEPLIHHVFSTGQKVVFNHEVSLPTGTRTFETVYAPITDATGTIHRVLGVGQDVTEIRQQWRLLQEQNYQLAEVNRLKEEFIATTSHELRTPLTAILGFSSVLLEESFGKLNPKQMLYVDRIHSSGEHLLELINDILDLSRIEADRLELEPQLVFIRDICESVISLVQERVMNHGLYLDVDVEPDLEYMVTDPRRLKQMLLNLLTNAIKFTPQGTVGLKIYRTYNETKEEGDSTVSTPETIHFQVWDTGIGIDEADQLRLFSPFSQIDSSLSRKYQGTGLGLVITRKLAELHGGSITLKSNSGQGSSFTISLPLYQSPETLANMLGNIDQASFDTVVHLVQHLPDASPPEEN